MDDDRDKTSRLDAAVAARLARLRTMPVDLSRLERAVAAQIPRPAARSPEQPLWIAWLRPMRAVAASVVVLISIAVAVMLSTSSGPVLASPARMAALHRDLVNGTIPAVQVDSVAAANRVLAAEWPQSPTVPEVPEEHVMACCLKRMDSKKLACVLLKDEGVPVTMMVAAAGDMRSPKSPTVVRGGVTYHVECSGKVNMVMTARHGRWVCLIGERPTEQLMDLADSLRF